jgi:hypothetical protein
MIATPTELKAFHTRVAALVGRALACTAQVIPRIDGWPDVAEDTAVAFVLKGRTPAAGTYAERARGRSQPVLPLFPAEAAELQATVFAGWSDEWKKVPQDRFELVSASWTFFWGFAYRQPHQLFRAEWDNVRQTGGHAAQPHWHFDKELTVEIYREGRAPAAPARAVGEEVAGPAAREDDLLELTSVPVLQELQLSGLHLGMGGWTNCGEGYACWQRRPDTFDSLLCWAVRTLEHARAQFPRLTRGEAVAV